MKYRFVINNEASEVYDEESIKKLIELDVLQQDTLAWCEGMKDWQTTGEIKELAALFEPDAAAHSTADPPPIPGQTNSTRSADDASLPPTPTETGKETPLGLTGLEEYARGFVYWCFRPWHGRPSRVRAYIDRDPRRTIPVAIALAVSLFLLLAFAISPFVSEDHAGPSPGPAGPGVDPRAMPPAAGSMEQWRIMRDAQRDTDRSLDDAYCYQRDSFDQQSETYRRGTYDWYGDD